MTLLERVENRPGFKKQSTNTWEGPCPKCGGTKRFVVWTKKDIFKCRECDFKGDLIGFLREVEDYSCREAFLAAGRECGATNCQAYEKCKGNKAPRRQKPASATPPAAKASSDWQPRQAEEPTDLWRQKGAEFVDWAHDQLLAAPEQLQYLASRGLPLDAVRENRLGFNPGAIQKGKPGPFFKQRASWGLENKRNDDDTRWITVFPIQRGIIIPSFRDERLYRIRIRRLDEDLAQYPEDQRPPKYLFLEGSGKGLVIRHPAAKAFLVVESDLCDLLVNRLAGDLVCSVPLTSCGIRPDTASVEPLSNAVVILNALDFDPRTNPVTGRSESPGGQNARWWQKHFPRSERHPVPLGKDPGDAYQAGADIRLWVISGLPVSLQPKQAAVNKDSGQEAAVGEWSEGKGWQLIRDARGMIESGCPGGGLEWIQGQQEIKSHIKAAEEGVDLAFSSANEEKLSAALAKLIRYYERAWEIFKSRPAVMEVAE